MSFHPKYLVPNGLTTLSLMLGLGSLVSASRGDAELAAWMILWCVIVDKLDGTMARVLSASSRFGAELDSFADFVAFGIAPAALVYTELAPLPAWQGGMGALLMACCGTYVLAAAVRLARFNITAPPLGDKYFYGIPTPICAAIAAAFHLTAHNHAAVADRLDAAAVYLVIAAGLMVSQVLLPKLRPRRNRLLNAFQIANIVAVFVVAPLRILPEYLLVLALGYLLIGAAWTSARGIPEQAESR